MISEIETADHGRRGVAHHTGVSGVLASLLTALISPALAFALPDDRFVELSDENDSWVYDLSTAHFVLPGRFTVLRTVIDKPEIMELKLNAIHVLEPYCKRPDGLYEAPTSLLKLGTPDLEPKKIEVKSSQLELGGRKIPTKQVNWSYPYKRLAIRHRNGLVEQHPEYFMCHGLSAKNPEDFRQQARLVIMNGSRAKELYDCKRGLMGFFANANDDASKAIIGPPRGGFLRNYVALCRQLTRELPYIPDSSSP